MENQIIWIMYRYTEMAASKYYYYACLSSSSYHSSQLLSFLNL